MHTELQVPKDRYGSVSWDHEMSRSVRFVVAQSTEGGDVAEDKRFKELPDVALFFALNSEAPPHCAAAGSSDNSGAAAAGGSWRKRTTIGATVQATR